MINNKRGLSAIVMTIIMVGLVLVAVGIVWAVVLNILEGQEEALDVSQQCLGIIIKAESIDCDGALACTVVLERATGSSGDPVDGVGITLSNDVESLDEFEADGNVAATKTVSIPTTVIATRADVRAYFIQDGEKKFCATI